MLIHLCAHDLELCMVSPLHLGMRMYGSWCDRIRHATCGRTEVGRGIDRLLSKTLLPSTASFRALQRCGGIARNESAADKDKTQHNAGFHDEVPKNFTDHQLNCSRRNLVRQAYALLGASLQWLRLWALHSLWQVAPSMVTLPTTISDGESWRRLSPGVSGQSRSPCYYD